MNAASLDQIDNAGRLLCSYDYKDMEGLVTVSSIIYHVFVLQAYGYEFVVVYCELCSLCEGIFLVSSFLM